MALLAIGFMVGTNQRKSAQLVNLCNIVNQPGIWVVASGTIKAYGVFVKIGMTIDTAWFCLAEHQGGVTCPAFGIQVLTIKDEAGGFMVE